MLSRRYARSRSEVYAYAGRWLTPTAIVPTSENIHTGTVAERRSQSRR